MNTCTYYYHVREHFRKLKLKSNPQLVESQMWCHHTKTLQHRTSCWINESTENVNQHEYVSTLIDTDLLFCSDSQLTFFSCSFVSFDNNRFKRLVLYRDRI